MKIDTRYHGEIDIQKEEVIHFKNGIPGFPDNKEYIVISLGDGSLFSVLQSTRMTELALAIMDPFSFYRDYEFKMPESTINQLGIQQKEDVQVYCVITLGEKLESSTVNLQAPIVINSRNKNGRQIVLNTDQYHTKHVLKSAKTKNGQEGSHARPYTKER